MATPSKRKIKAKSSQPLTVILQDTRLKKFSLEILLQVEEAGGGLMQLEYEVSIISSTNIDELAASLRISGMGHNKNDPSKIAFTVDAVMLGIFELSRKPSEEELKGAVGIDMANFIAPVLADSIETAMVKAGYPRLVIPRHVPEQSR